MNKPGNLGKLGDLGDKASSVIGKEAKSVAKAVRSQISVSEVGAENSDGQTSGQSANPPQEQNQAFVKEMYGIQGGKEVPSKEQAEAQNKASKTEDEQKLQEIRALARKLHQETYYDPLIEKSKPQEDEERSQERVERQEKEEEKEDWLKKQKEDKKAPVSVHRAQRTTEMGKTSG